MFPVHSFLCSFLTFIILIHYSYCYVCYSSLHCCAFGHIYCCQCCYPILDDTRSYYVCYFLSWVRWCCLFGLCVCISFATAGAINWFCMVRCDFFGIAIYHSCWLVIRYHTFAVLFYIPVTFVTISTFGTALFSSLFPVWIVYSCRCWFTFALRFTFVHLFHVVVIRCFYLFPLQCLRLHLIGFVTFSVWFWRSFCFVALDFILRLFSFICRFAVGRYIVLMHLLPGSSRRTYVAVCCWHLFTFVLLVVVPLLHFVIHLRIPHIY